jgi:hypothetical protein
MAELGRPISEHLQAFARNGRLKRRIGAPLGAARVLCRAVAVITGPWQAHGRPRMGHLEHGLITSPTNGNNSDNVV